MTRELDDYPEEYPKKTGRGCLIGLGISIPIIIILIYLLIKLYADICILMDILYAN